MIRSPGVVLYEMLAGEHPFPNITSVERMYRHINDPLPQIASLPLKNVEAINQVIQKATAKKPAHRYEDVSAFADAFLEAAHLKQPPLPESLVEMLTPREQEILQLMINGLSNREIAEQLVSRSVLSKQPGAISTANCVSGTVCRRLHGVGNCISFIVTPRCPGR